MSPAQRKQIPRQICGYWIDRDRDHLLLSKPTCRPTGAVLPRLRENRFVDFLCLDLVRTQAGARFIWSPLSEAGRYTYAHSLGLLYKEKWRLLVWDEDGSKHRYDAVYADPLAPSKIGSLYGPEAESRARPDRDAMQLRLRART